MSKQALGQRNDMRKGLFVICIFSLIFVRWLFVPGFLPTHDGEYHLIRFYEFGRMLAAGSLIPRWAPGLNSGYGVPIFNFHYPLPNYIASFFHALGWSLADAFRLTLATGYLTASISSYIWLRRYVRGSAAFAGALMGALVPYWFVDIFVRGSVGEVLAIGFSLLAFAAIAWGRRAFVTIAATGLVLSHNIMAIIFLPILFIYALTQSPRLIGWIVLGIGISAYFWLPAIVEAPYVLGLNTVSFVDHFPDLYELLIPSWGTGFSGSTFSQGEMSYQIGIMPIVVLFISTIFLLLKRWRPDRHLAGFFLLGWFVSIILMLPVAIPFWKSVPYMANIQYPWRLLSVGIPAVSFLSALLFARWDRTWIMFVAALLSCLLVFPYTKPVLYEPRSDDYYLSRREFTDGTSSLGNSFSTRWMSWQPNRPKNRMEILSGVGSVAMKYNDATTFAADARLTTDAMVQVHVAYYPGWRVTVDGKDVPVKPDSKGMITVPVTKGNHSVAVHFSETPFRFAADLFSGVCLFWLFYSSILKRRLSHDYAYRN